MRLEEHYSADDLLTALEKWGFKTSTITHGPLYTVDESSYLVDVLPGAHCKSLFLKNKKGKYYLVVMSKFCKLDINALSAQLGGGRMAFASEDRLMEKLGLRPGSVSPFALINSSAVDVQLILDEELMGYDILNFHPLINTMTTSITKQDFVNFLDRIKHNPMVLNLPRRT